MSSPMDRSAFGTGVSQQQHHHHHTPDHQHYNHPHHGPSTSPPSMGDGRSAMSLSMSPPVGGGYASDVPRLEGRGPPYQHQQSPSDEKSPMSLSMSPYPGAGGGGNAGEYLPDLAARQHMQLQERPHHQRSDVSAVIADVAARRALRSQQQSTDMDIVRRGTPMSERRQAVSQPRFLQAELDADGPEPSAPASAVQGRRKTRTNDDRNGALRSAALGSAAPPGEGDFDDEDEEPRDILALVKQGDKLGVAVYREAVNAIDIQETHAFLTDIADTVEGIKLVVRPRLILTDLNMVNNSALFDLVIAPLVEGGDQLEYRIVKRSCWEYQSAVRGICANLQVQTLERHPVGPAAGARGADGEREQGRERAAGAGVDPMREAYNRLGSIIDFQAQQQVRALGALLTHLQSTVFALEGSGSVGVTAVRQLDASDTMRIDGMTLRSLGIIAEEFHPNVLNGKGRSKEGFSVFGLFDRTKSVSGRRCLKEWMLKPLHNIAAISARQNSVEVLMRSENAEICRRMRSQLKKSFDMTRIIMRIKKVASTFADWCKLIQSIESALDVRDGLAVLRTSAAATVAVEGGYDHHDFLARLLDNIDSVVLRRCLEGLCEVIDPVASAQDKDLVIRTGFDEELDRMRDTLNDLPEILRGVGQIVLNENALLKELSVEYVPQIGFLTALHERFGDLVPEDFSFAFSQGDTVYYKSPTMREVDDGIGDIQAQITDKQAKIMRELEDALIEEEGALHAAAAALAELDASLALASVATDFGFVRPEVVEDNVIMIKNGRHPLQELTVDTFIPNDTYIADGSRVALITGANCSGKSVYLKQVGVIVYLAHVGSFVPAEKAIIGLTDRIFTRIATVETSALPQSSFTIDVNQIAHMVRSSTPRSLLLIDEFGKGTAPADGVGLVAALLRHLSRAGRKCLFTLHFHEIFSQGLVKVHGPDDLRTELKDVSVFRMDVHVPSPQKAADSQGEGLGEGDHAEGGGGDHDWATAPPIPLFKLTPGMTVNSHGIACAQVAGIPDSVLSRAQEVASFEDKGEPIRPINRAGGRESARSLTLASPDVQKALQLFLTPPGDASWKNASDDLIETLLATVDSLCGLAVSAP